MLFNSIQFILFLPIVFVFYWVLAGSTNRKYQNIILLVASYFFYACWDFRFLFLLIFSTLLDYYSGKKIFSAKRPSIKRLWLWLSISINLGFLGIFKYYNFFIESFKDALSLIHIQINIEALNVILPVGISFYTFHGLSYILDIYRDKISSENDFVDYSLFVSFFPLLVAGPIERATHLLPQIKKQRHFDYSQSVNGLRQILWGLFKKIVIADSCAEIVNPIFSDPSLYSGSTLVLSAILFAFQIYCDFSGYSDVALGVAKLFGFDLLRNFAYPYFSRDIAEFWRRWHISLSSWFRDYLYIPLGGNKGSKLLKARNILLIFLVSGLWHGAKWTFVIWGGVHALFFLPLMLTNRNRNNLSIVAEGKILPSVKELVSLLTTFALVVFAWIFFRAETLHIALTYLQGIFSPSLFVIPEVIPRRLIIIIILFIIIEWIGREDHYAIEYFGFKWPRFARIIFYYSLIGSIFFLSASGQQFIYFQF